MARILARLTDAAADAGVDPTHAELAARTVVYYVLGSPPTSSPACSGTPRAPSCPTASRCFGGSEREIRVRARLLVDGIAAHSDTVSGVDD